MPRGAGGQNGAAGTRPGSVAAVSTHPDPPSPGDEPHHPLVKTVLEGQLSGLSYAYRGASIDCMKSGHVCRLALDGPPLTPKQLCVFLSRGFCDRFVGHDATIVHA